MGADFLIAAIPLFDKTPHRRAVFEDAITALDEKALQGISDWFAWWGADGPWTEFESREAVDRIMEAWDEADFDSRETSAITEDPHLPYAIVLTGGLSWGDAPTMQYEWFQILEVLRGQIGNDLFAQWATEDHKKFMSEIEERRNANN